MYSFIINGENVPKLGTEVFQCMDFETLTVSFGRTRIPSALTGHTSGIQDLRVLAQVYRLVKRHISLCGTVRTMVAVEKRGL